MSSSSEKALIAGTNRFEILLFSLSPEAGAETFAINVFKIREVIKAVPVTGVPGAPQHILGIISLRGTIMPVVDLPAMVYPDRPVGAPAPYMMVAEYGGRTLVFGVHAVQTIARVDWADVQPAPDYFSSKEKLITGIVNLDSRLVSILDVEQLLSRFVDLAPKGLQSFRPLTPDEIAGRLVVFADDSAVARQEIEATLKGLGIPYIGADTGAQAWQRLCALADSAGGRPVRSLVACVLTDVEMPVMDGYVLCQKIKSDPRLSSLPVLMYSSLSSGACEARGLAAGADKYLRKFDRALLAEGITDVCTRSSHSG